MTTQPDLITTDKIPPPPLEAARRRLGAALDRQQEVQDLIDEQGPEAQPLLDAADAAVRDAAREVLCLEKQALGK